MVEIAFRKKERGLIITLAIGVLIYWIIAATVIFLTGLVMNITSIPLWAVAVGLINIVAPVVASNGFWKFKKWSVYLIAVYIALVGGMILVPNLRLIIEAPQAVSVSAYYLIFNYGWLLLVALFFWAIYRKWQYFE